MAVASAGPYASLHLAPDRQTRQHPTTRFFLQAGCPSCRPTNSVKALKAHSNVVTVLQLLQLQPFNGLFSRTTWVSRYQIGKTYLDFTGARDSEWQWHQLGHMQVCTSLQTDNHASTPPLCFLQAGCPSCRPTDSVKALKAHSNVVTVDDFIYPPGNIRVFSASTLLAGHLEGHPACKN